MDLSTSVLLGVVGLLAFNQLLMRIAEMWSTRWLFYSVQLVNLIVGTAICALGLPGFEDMRVVSWFIGLMFFWRVVQNNRIRLEFLQAAIEAERDQAARERDSAPTAS